MRVIEGVRVGEIVRVVEGVRVGEIVRVMYVTENYVHLREL